MTPEEIARFWSLYVQFKPTQRKGQAMMNALRYVAPELYDMVTGTTADVFYRDTSQDIMRFRDTVCI